MLTCVRTTHLYFLMCVYKQEEREFLSFYNEYELLVVVEMIKTLLAFGIKADQIGIIALCKLSSFSCNSERKEI